MFHHFMPHSANPFKPLYYISFTRNFASKIFIKEALYPH